MKADAKPVNWSVSKAEAIYSSSYSEGDAAVADDAVAVVVAEAAEGVPVKAVAAMMTTHRFLQ